jgi:hypothetical protein
VPIRTLTSSLFLRERGSLAIRILLAEKCDGCPVALATVAMMGA